MADFNINLAGFCIAGLFVAVWAGEGLVYWRVGRVEARWAAHVAAGPGQGPGPLTGAGAGA